MQIENLFQILSDSSKGSAFSHRFNADGTIDSICRSCFMTAATGINEAALDEHESNHVCETRLVERLRSYTHEERAD
jgi:hypothetical protein